MISFQPTRLAHGLPPSLSTRPYWTACPSHQGMDQVCFGTAKKAPERWESPKTQKRLANFYQHHHKQYDEIQHYLEQLFPKDLGDLVFRFKEFESFLQKAKSNHEKNTGDVKDCIGARLILKTGSREEITQMLSYLTKALAQKEVNLSLMIHSLQEGASLSESKYYLHPGRDVISLKQFSTFQEAGFARKNELNSGAVFVNMTFWKPGAKKRAGGTYFSLQLCGPQVHPLMEVDHLFYAVVIHNKKLPSALQDIETQLKSLSAEQKSLYAAYLRGWYRYARDAEENFQSGFQKPPYPNELPLELKVEPLAHRLATLNPTSLASWVEKSPLYQK